jgi:hypothetical protein
MDIRDDALAELDRLREEVVRLQARIDELEAAELARQELGRRRGLASLIPGGSSQAG